MAKKAFIFPGQASQYVGMGVDLIQRYERAHDIYQTADDILGFKLSKISFEGPEDELKQTRVTQPAIFVHSVIVNLLLAEKGFRPDMVAGHSLGEYSALVTAGALGFESALELVKLRAELMQQAGEHNPGSMAAVLGLNAEELKNICKEAEQAGIVQPANFNSSSQIVISGSVEGVQKAMELAKENGAKKVVQLVVSGAFHSPLMEFAQNGLKEKLEATSFVKAEIPVYNNVTAKPVTEPVEIRELLFKQLTFPVQWAESIRNMILDGAGMFYEVGPKNVLKGLMRSIDRSVRVATIGTPEEIEAIS
ncbi:ACP S-malonyltransferase [candidate division KSB1 bacterium]|nr:ACP S-malonyltransferase [candidate division KSB1 bacterium]